MPNLLVLLIITLTAFYLIDLAIIKIRNYLAARAKSQYFRGTQFAKEEIAFYKGDSQKLWHMCDPSFDNNPFDKGMADELTRQGIRHPLDPLGE
jgi:hypothetical protein